MLLMFGPGDNQRHCSHVPPLDVPDFQVVRRRPRTSFSYSTQITELERTGNNITTRGGTTELSVDHRYEDGVASYERLFR